MGKISRIHARAGEIHVNGQVAYLTDWALSYTTSYTPTMDSLIPYGGRIELDTTPDVRPDSGQRFQLFPGIQPSGGYFSGLLWPDGTVTDILRVTAPAASTPATPYQGRLIVRRLTDWELMAR